MGIWGKVKAASVFIAVTAVAILYALLQKEKADTADEHEQIADTNYKTTSESAEEIILGAARQQEVLNEDVDTDNRDILS